MALCFNPASRLATILFVCTENACRSHLNEEMRRARARVSFPSQHGKDRALTLPGVIVNARILTPSEFSLTLGRLSTSGRWQGWPMADLCCKPSTAQAKLGLEEMSYV
jgi:hypothetical protein